MEQGGRTTVQTASDAAVGDSTVAGNTVIRSAVHDPNNDAVFDNTVPKIF